MMPPGMAAAMASTKPRSDADSEIGILTAAGSVTPKDPSMASPVPVTAAGSVADAPTKDMRLLPGVTSARTPKLGWKLIAATSALTNSARVIVDEYLTATLPTPTRLSLLSNSKTTSVPAAFWMRTVELSPNAEPLAALITMTEPVSNSYVVPSTTNCISSRTNRPFNGS